MDLLTLDSLWNELDIWMQSEIQPKAQLMDANSCALFQAFRQLGDHNLLALRLPECQGGLGWDEQAYSQFQILIASYSGALAFLTTQHHSALRMLGLCDNEGLKQHLIPSLVQGRMGVGVGFSQLRRPGAPMTSAIPTSDGFLITGTVPWVTGFGCFNGFICGAFLPTKQILMGWVPLLQEQSNHRCSISEPIALAAMESTQTVAVTLKDWFMDASQVIAIHETDWLQQKDTGNTLHHGFYSLGTAKGALRLFNGYQQKFSIPHEIQSAIAAFQEEYRACESQMIELLPDRRDHPERCLQAKAKAIHLAGRCAQAAVAITGGSANNRTHPAQRIYREVLAFTVFGQTSAAKVATLSALSSYRS